MENLSHQLPQNFSRRMTSTLFVIEKRLDELTRIISRMDSPVMLEMDIHLSESEKTNTLYEIQCLRQKILYLKDKYKLEARKESFRQTANSYISMSIIDLTDILSSRMKGYGKLSEDELMDEYDRDIEELTALLRNFPR